MERDPKLLIIARGWPPMLAGSNILLNNIFTSYQGNFEAAVGHAYKAYSDPAFTPPCPSYYLDLPKNKYITRYYEHIMRFFPFIVRNFFSKHIRRYKPDILFIPFPEINFVIPAYQVAIKHKLPYYIHMHDLWQENYAPGTWKRKAADEWEEKIIRGAKRVLCMNQVQADHYRKKYNITNLSILPHTITPESIADGKKSIVPPAMPDKTVLFVGTVSDMMNTDALRQFSKAVSLLPSDIKVLFCSSATKETMAANNIDVSRMEMKFVSRAEVQKLQSSAHILFAPLSHKQGAMDEVRTVFSTKLLEYMVSGRPILVFAPSDSFHAISAQKGGWGYVVDEDSPEKLADAILKMLEDEELCSGLVESAFREAQSRKASIFSNQLLQWVKEDVGKS